MSEIKARVYGVDYRILENSDGTVHTTDELQQVYSELYGSVHRSDPSGELFRVYGGSEEK